MSQLGWLHRMRAPIEPFGACIIVGVIAIAFTACVERADVAGPTRLGSEDSKGLDMGRLTRLRDIGEGCTIAAVDSQGVFRAFAVPRGQLPMALPAIHHDAITGQGNGRSYRTVIHRRDAGAVAMTCWAPDTLTVQQFADVVKQSINNPGWKGLLNRVAHAPKLDKPSQRAPLSPEALAYVSEMLDPSSATAPASSSVGADGVGASSASRRITRSSTSVMAAAHSIAPPQRPSRFGSPCVIQDDECSCDWDWITYYYYDATYTENAWVCIDLTSDDSAWSIDLCFFIDDYYLSDDDYAYLLDNGELPEETYLCSGTTTPNDLDNMRQQYADSALAAIPDCGYFDYQASSPHFGWAVVQSHSPSAHYSPASYDPSFSYAIYRPSLKAALETLYGDTTGGISITASNRIYSTPHHNNILRCYSQASGAVNVRISPCSTTLNSRHVYGDAADVQVPDSSNWVNLSKYAYQLDPRPCREPGSLSHTHLHIDFRAASGALAHSDACPSTYQIPGTGLP